MNSFSRYAFLISAALVVGAVLFAGGFMISSFIWSHLAVSNPKEVTAGDGIMVLGGSLVLGCTLGIGGLFGVLYKFWPRAPKLIADASRSFRYNH